MEPLLRRLRAIRIVPVLVIPEADHAHTVGAALQAGGVSLAEVTFRTPAALAALSTLAARGDMMVGAGTVLDPGQVDAAVDAGATFVVSPGLSRDVVARCRELAVPVVPGVATPSDVMAALQIGCTVLKYFPASVMGGPAGLASLAAAFPAVRFVPTGGITAADATDYLAHPSVVAVGGSWMVPASLIAAGDREGLELAVRAAVRSLPATTGQRS
jgi:2-dehydro-3-deoxyphosphogluconate aldolase/(4S)-4-hydroxy-2-oxoglutarate aldolase